MSQLERHTGNVATVTYGCQMSEREADLLTEIAVQEGYQRCADIHEADLILINTCCVRESAENKILGKIGELKRLKEQRPGLKIAVSGCMVQQPDRLEWLMKRAPHVDLWTGTDQMNDFARLLRQLDAGAVVAVIGANLAIQAEDLPVAGQGRKQVNVNIMYGCNNFCTYCIVPYVRGRERSRSREDILAEIRTLVASGCREVTLLGQNVNSYGLDAQWEYDFADLLQSADRIPGIARVRFMTSHPKDLSDKLIETVAQGRSLCEHFHLPVQSGSNEILKRMNRRYTREYYLERLDKIRQRIPQASITSDMIVGFPGETEADFQDTLDLVAQADFSQLFTFVYSRRSGTAAATMPDQIPLEEKKRRLQTLMALQEQKSLAWKRRLVGQTVEVMTEGVSKNNQQRLSGRTRGNELVVFPGDVQRSGEIIRVKIVDTTAWTLIANALKCGER
ncbi:MAG: tRNA (N6-isopentenyl adenosine(37)-C2)-methylthiotransferase MiaB [Peptococcaceae bacterium]|jgi:tRNA-2-methylthio-N6-dimethylallyladenosine synthase|nr:tRNA (N6-isopentenyl adenosine(37)-C2)-methylthiotransferase MiaB [Peptococcaceae bacterium]